MRASGFDGLYQPFVERLRAKRGRIPAVREKNPALDWAATAEDDTPAPAVAVGHFVQVGLGPDMLFENSPDEMPLTQ